MPCGNSEQKAIKQLDLNDSEVSITIIINNYNYGRFLDKCISSVLDQTVQPYELIVVDDGSTDDSGEVLLKFKEQARIIYKKNGGQASAFNAGFAVASGDWIWFVDADDFLHSTAVEEVRKLLSSDYVKIHFPLRMVNQAGEDLGSINPSNPLSQGTVINEILQNGDYSWPPTTGNIFSRKLLSGCMPVPETQYKLCADFYLCSYAGVMGKIALNEKPLAYYRIHPTNGHFGFNMRPERLKSNGEILLNVPVRMMQLVKNQINQPGYEYPYSRTVLESLIISKRFGKLKLPAELSGMEIHKKWINSAQVKKTQGKARITAFMFWTMLNYAPRFIAKRLILAGIAKGNRARGSHTRTN